MLAKRNKPSRISLHHDYIDEKTNAAASSLPQLQHGSRHISVEAQHNGYIRSQTKTNSGQSLKHSRSKRDQQKGRKVLMQVIWKNEGESLTAVGSRQRATLTRLSIGSRTVSRFTSRTILACHDIGVRRSTYLSFYHNFYVTTNSYRLARFEMLTSRRKSSDGCDVRRQKKQSRKDER